MPTGTDKIQEPIEDGSMLAGLLVLELISDGDTWTREQLAYICGVSLTNIRLTEERALKKLKKAYKKAFIKAGIIMEHESESELQRKIWAVVTHDEVVGNNLTYEASTHVIRDLGPKFGNEATIVSKDTADRMLERKIKEELPDDKA